MVIRRAEFVTSMGDMQGQPITGLPEIAMVGKSNVGKSSLINRLTSNKKLAHTSGEPGKTRLINFYKINEILMLVDLPGYGFARVSKVEKAKWSGLIESYLTGSQWLRHALQLVDMRHEPTKDDITMVEYLRHYGIPFTVIGTKADKLSKAECARSLPVISRTLQIQPWEIIPFSSRDDTGKEAILELLGKVLEEQEE